MIRVQEQDNNANGYLDSNVPSIGYPTIGTHDDDSKCSRLQICGSILEDLNW